MSQTETTDESTDEEPGHATAEEWQELDDEERDERLHSKMEELNTAQQTATGDEVLSVEEKESAVAKLQAVSQKEREAVITVRGVDIPIPVHTLSEAQQETVREKIQVIFDVDDLQEQEDVDDVEDLDEDVLDQLEDLDDWLNDFLAEVTVEEEMDQDYWEAGEGIPAGTKYLLFFNIAEHMTQEMEQVGSFR